MKWGCSEETVANPKMGPHHCCCLIVFLMRIPEPQLAECICLFQGQALLLWSLFLAISALKGVWQGVCISTQAVRNTYIKPLVKYTATLIHYFWCNHTHNFLVAQQKEHLWFHSPAVLTSHCGQEQDILEVCCVLEGMEHCERGARRFILRALTRQC